MVDRRPAHPLLHRMSDPFTLFHPTVFLRSLPGLLLILLPGLAWVRRYPLPRQDILSRLGRAWAFGLAWNAVLALWFSQFPWQGSVLSALAVASLALTLALRPSLPRLQRADLLGLAAAAFLLTWRFFQVRRVVLPPWVDPVHHTLIVRQIMEKARLPRDLLPDLNVPFYYHFGFHLNAALIGWAGRLSPLQATFVAGQVMNAAVPIGLYTLARSIWRDSRRAWVALFLSGLIMRMPAYYASWGRYPLLTGLTIGLGTLALATRLRHRQHPPPEMIILVGGLLVSHYFAAPITLFALASLFLWDIWSQAAGRMRRWPSLTLAAGAGSVLAAPWLVRVWTFAHNMGGVALPGAQPSGFARQPAYLWQLLSPRLDHALYLLALAAALWSWRSRRNRPWVLWGGMLLALALPVSPALRPFRPDHWVIVLFLPATLLLSNLAHDAARFPLPARQHRVRMTALGLLALALFGYGLRAGNDIVNPATVFVTAADVQAIRWANTHLPPEARVLVNAALWQQGLYRGVDGGWWLLPLTHHQTFPPPAFIGFGDPDQTRRISRDAAVLSGLTTCDQAFYDLLQRHQITHLYLREGVGSLQASALDACRGVRKVYQKAGVTIWEVLPSDTSLPGTKNRPTSG